ncbi:hypothetical protein [Flavobacterium sp. UBA6135]|uniref:hypothetical protein n=1 Tax=Flavobacterium sp. UBA6135 TaxID=1946553 RepID=UPI0025C63292|nr:hypothetical protein [Flavobacterium sp. UBA6135]
MKNSIIILFLLFAFNVKANDLVIPKLNKLIEVEKIYFELDDEVNYSNLILENEENCVRQALWDYHYMINQEVDLETALHVAYEMMMFCILYEAYR